MNITQTPQTGGFTVSNGGSSAELTVKRPGMVTVMTPGRHHVLVDHIPLYVDFEIHVHADGHLEEARGHAVYRYGEQANVLTSKLREQAGEIVEAMVRTVLEAHPRQVGVVAEDDSREALQVQIAEIARWRKGVQSSLERALRDRAKADETIAAAQARLVELDEQTDELTAQIDAIPVQVSGLDD